MLSSSLPPPPYPPRLYSFANELEKLSIQREAVDLRETRETTEHEVLLGLVQQGPESFQAYHSQVHVFYDTPYFVYWLYCVLELWCREEMGFPGFPALLTHTYW